MIKVAHATPGASDAAVFLFGTSSQAQRAAREPLSAEGESKVRRAEALFLVA
jgi:hypothetical protein